MRRNFQLSRRKTTNEAQRDRRKKRWGGTEESSKMGTGNAIGFSNMEVSSYFSESCSSGVYEVEARLQLIEE